MLHLQSLSLSGLECTAASNGERAVPSTPFEGVSVNMGHSVAVVNTLINMSRRSQELETALSCVPIDRQTDIQTPSILVK